MFYDDKLGLRPGLPRTCDLRSSSAATNYSDRGPALGCVAIPSRCCAKSRLVGRIFVIVLTIFLIVFLNIIFFLGWSDPTCVEFWPRILLYGVFPYIYILNSKNRWENLKNRGWGLVCASFRVGRNFCFLYSVSSDLAIFGKVVTTITEYVVWILGTNMSTTTTIGHPWVSTYVARVVPYVEAIISS